MSKKVNHSSLPAKIRRNRLFPLSFSQERIWFIDQLQGSSDYHMFDVLRIEGNLNNEALTFAFRTIVERHEVLRSVVHVQGDIPHQRLLDADDWALKVLPASDGASLHQQLERLISQPFDLGVDFMLRVHLLHIDYNVHLLVIVIHHIASDGWSVSILINEFSELYASFCENRPYHLPVLEIQFSDYAVLQRNAMSGHALDAELSYWIDQLADPQPLNLPTDFSQSAESSKTGATIEFFIDQHLTDQLMVLSTKESSTLFMTLVAALNILLSRYTGQNDISIGTPVALRNKPEVQNLIGFFINTLVLRSTVDNQATFRDFLAYVKRNTLEALNHQEAPFEKVVEAVVKKRDLTVSPLFSVMFVLQYGEAIEDFSACFPGFKISHENVCSNTSPFDLNFSLTKAKSGVSAKIEYRANMFRPETIHRMAGHYLTLLSSITANPSLSIAYLKMLSEQEEDRILNYFNSPAIDSTNPHNLLDLLESGLAKHRDKIAIIFNNDEITYSEVHERSNQFANYLRSKNIGSSSLVPVCIERSIDMVIAILGILKSGAAYVPIDPAYPSDRIKYILNDVRGKAIVTDSACREKMTENGGGIFLLIDVDLEHELICDQDKNPSIIDFRTDALAYIIYTSGSTGWPKGVMIEHSSVFAFLTWCVKEFENDSFNTVYAVTSITFDLSVFEMFYPLIVGKTIRIIDSALSIPKFLTHDTQILINTVPSVIKTLLKQCSDLQNVSVVNLAGEPIPADVCEDLVSRPIAVRNLYGPSEDTTYSTVFRINKGKANLIGKPISNTQVYIMDSEMRLCPIGVVGEIYIGGSGLARGYLNRPDLTMEKFISHEFVAGVSVRLYRTGDMGRWTHDGDIEYLGRTDHQVKIRGYRIELGEIESILYESGFIRQCVVIADEDSAGMKRLVGYVVTEGKFEREQIIVYLKSRLPDYMVPYILINVESLPLTINGKIDRKLLLGVTDELLTSGYEGGRNALEKGICRIWESYLGLDRVGIADNFFSIGGHSLLATRVVSAMRKELKVEVKIRDIFDYPVIKELSSYLLGRNVEKFLPAIESVARPSRIPLSFTQQRLWFIHQLEGSVQYHIPEVVRLRGRLNKDLLQSSFQSIVDRHESLRTMIIEENGEGYQYISGKGKWRMNVIRGLSSESILTQVEELINVPFNLSRDPKLRVDLIELGSEDNILVLTLHHISSDGWSLGLIIKELTSVYNSGFMGHEILSSPLPIQYADYAIWQRRYLDGDFLESKLNYWRSQLLNVSPLNLPVDYARPVVQSMRGSSVDFIIDARISRKLNMLGQANNSTLFMVLLSAFKVLLYRYSGNRDLCVGSPVANRGQQEIEEVIGFFVNMLALRTQISEQADFISLLEQVKEVTLAAYEHQDVPFEKVVEAVVRHRDLSRSPLFEVMFAFQNTARPTEDLHLEGLSLEWEKFTQSTSKFDISFILLEDEGVLKGSVEYCTDLFMPETINRMISHYNQLLISITEDPTVRINSIQMVSKEEEHTLLVEFNDTFGAQSGSETVVDLFEAQAARVPEHVAIVFNNESVTYNDLNNRSNQLAHYLKKIGVKEDDVIPLCIGRSIEMVVGIMGILKAGGAYVPISPENPVERNIYMLEDVGSAIVVGDSSAGENVRLAQGKVFISLDTDELNEQPVHNPERKPTRDQLAYVIYTSGSTGKPKGVMIEHGSLINFLLSMQELISCNEQSLVLSLTTFTFDIAYLEIFLPLISGANTLMANTETSQDGFLISKLLSTHRISHIQGTPSTFQFLIDSRWNNSSNAKVLVGGEALSPKLKDALTTRGKIFNVYGPTETTIWSTIATLNSESRITIGKPISNTQVYIMDSEMRLCPIGVVGEIYIGGSGLARGYLNRPDLTMEKFISHEFVAGVSVRLYRTGDMGRWTHDGDIEYLGRTDHQVKIRGYRIELGEIESILYESGFIRQCVVIADEDSAGMKRLVGYVVTEGKFEREQIIVYLKSRLPDYMVPYILINVESLPLTINGKIDRKLLLGVTDELLTSGYEGGRNALEKGICRIWESYLGLDRVGIADNFFSIGGHSLLATRVVSAMRKELKVEVKIRDIFDYPVIKELSSYLLGRNVEKFLPAIESVARPSRIPLSFTQQRLWFIHQLEGSVQYHIPEVVRLRGRLNKDLLQSSFQSIVDRHESLRTMIIEENGEGYQYISGKGKWRMNVIRGLSSESILTQVEELINVPFNLSRDPKLRVDLIELGSEDNILVLTLHHISSDGWSLGLIIKELTSVYNSGFMGHEILSSPLPIQYADYAIWQRRYLDGDFLESKLNYWRSQLLNVSPLNLPVDYARPVVQSMRGSSVDFIIDARISRKLNMLGQANNSTLFMVLLSAFKVLLYRYSGNRDLCVGSPVANRGQQEIEEVIGFFVNMLALRTQISEQADFISLLEQVKEVTLAAYEHQDVPFEKVVEAVVRHRDLSRSPLFEVMFAFQNTARPTEDLHLEGLSLEWEKFTQSTSKFDISFILLEDEGVLKGSVEYCTDLFMPETINRMISHYNQLLISITEDPTVRINSIQMVSKEEEHTLLVEFNDTFGAQSGSETVVDLFEAQAARVPEHVAIVFNNESVTYNDLNNRSNQLAHYLKKIGVKEDDVIPLCIGRSIEMVVGIMGILKAGGAYVPISPENPVERNIYMLEDVGSAIVVGDSSAGENVRLAQGKVFISLDTDELNEQPVHNPERKPTRDQLAYVIYTSGSTGKPKGVMIEHGSLINYLQYGVENYVPSTNCCRGTFYFLSHTFDASLTALFLPLISSGRLVIGKKSLDVFSDENFTKNAPYDFIKLVPAQLPLLNLAVASEKMFDRIILGGEQLHSSDLTFLCSTHHNIVIVNEYGPTEATVGCTTLSFGSSSIIMNKFNGTLSIGKPIRNTQIYILNDMVAAPIGVVGEICIGGVQLARGYLNNSELTAEKFTTITLAGNKKRIYRTGDMGKWLPNGTIEFLGRTDDQLKIRGYRIELGEVEHALMESNFFAKVYANAEDINGSKTLVAYVVRSHERNFNEAEVCTFLQNRLPDYMMPTRFVQVDAIPLTLHGKIDRKKLQLMDNRILHNNNRIATPKTPTEEQLILIWQELIGASGLNVLDNFFDVGGNSIKIVKMAEMVRKNFGCSLSVVDAFKYSNISALAAYIDSLNENHSVEREENVTNIDVMENTLNLLSDRDETGA